MCIVLMCCIRTVPINSYLILPANFYMTLPAGRTDLALRPLLLRLLYCTLGLVVELCCMLSWPVGPICLHVSPVVGLSTALLSKRKTVNTSWVSCCPAHQAHSLLSVVLLQQSVALYFLNPSGLGRVRKSNAWQYPVPAKHPTYHIQLPPARVW